MSGEFELTSPPSLREPWAKWRPVMWSGQSEHWATPDKLYERLHAEFDFTLDPCPLQSPNVDGLTRSWKGERVYCNPPYGPGIDRWLMKAFEADVAVYLLPARTDTRWWHTLAMYADEIRFLRGRIVFGTARHGAPFPSVLLVYRKPVTPPNAEPPSPSGLPDTGGPHALD